MRLPPPPWTDPCGGGGWAVAAALVVGVVTAATLVPATAAAWSMALPVVPCLLAAALVSLAITGGVSAGLLGALLPALSGTAVLIVPAALVAACAARAGRGAQGWLSAVAGAGVLLLLAGAVVRVAVYGGIAWSEAGSPILPWAEIMHGYPRVDALLPAVALPIALLWARLLVPARAAPLGTLTLIDTVLGQGTFLVCCTLMPLLLPLLMLAGSRRRRLTGFLLRLGSRAVFTAAPFLRWRCVTVGALPAGPWVLVSNHESVLDILACCAAPGRPRVQLAKPWVFRAPFLGWAARVGGMLPMDALAEGRVPAIPEECDLVIFPEGTRGDGRELARFHSGAVQAAEDLGRPLVAAIQHGSAPVLGRGGPWVRTGLFTTRLMAVPDLGAGTRVQRSTALRTWMAARLAERPAVPGWLRVIVGWESAAQQGPVARWRALRRPAGSEP